jgi:hypothetical protein
LVFFVNQKTVLLKLSPDFPGNIRIMAGRGLLNQTMIYVDNQHNRTAQAKNTKTFP